MSGKKEDVLSPPVDFLTQASITHATHDEANRWRPRTPPSVTPASFRFVDFTRDVAPVLETRCSNCHSGETPSGGLSLGAEATTHYTDAYESLLTTGAGSGGGYAWVDAATHRARRSALIERLLGAELDAPRAVTGQCPPGQALSEAELGVLIRWIELGAAYRGLP